MLNLPPIFVACVVTASATAGIAWFLAKTWVENVRAAERRQHEQTEQQSRERYARELQELQHSLAEEVETLRERSRRPLRTLVDSFLS